MVSQSIRSGKQKGNQCNISNVEKKENYSKILLFTVQFTGSSWDELRHIRQAVGFLVHLLETKKGLSFLDLVPEW